MINRFLLCKINWGAIMKVFFYGKFPLRICDFVVCFSSPHLLITSLPNHNLQLSTTAAAPGSVEAGRKRKY